MPKSELRLIKNAREYLPQNECNMIPSKIRGVYVLYKRRGRVNAQSHHFDFVYIGMASSNIRRRVNSHKNTKGSLWTHFSFYEVWDNISDEEIAELEGLFRHLYKYDSKANSLNRQKGYKKLDQVRKRSDLNWL
jgi:hypothetical protein